MSSKKSTNGFVGNPQSFISIPKSVTKKRDDIQQQIDEFLKGGGQIKAGPKLEISNDASPVSVHHTI